jgi:hypothetical protein
MKSNEVCKVAKNVFRKYALGEQCYPSKSSIFWNITPCGPLKVNQRFEGTRRLHLQSRRINRPRNQCEISSKQRSCLAYSSTLKMEATCSSETMVDFHRTTRRYIPEYWLLHNHRCENLKSCIIFPFCFIRNVNGCSWGSPKTSF